MSDPLFAAENVHVGFDVGGRRSGKTLRAVDDVSLRIESGEILGLVGESGSGKTTFGRTIAGLQEPTTGTVSLDGRSLQARRSGADRRAIQMVFQDPYTSLNPRMTVRQVLVELLKIHHLVEKYQLEARCVELVERVGLPRRVLNAQPRSFSGGQRQRVAIARALAVEPRVIVADEAVSALDVSVQATILDLFRSLRDDHGIAILFVTHDLGVAHHLCDRIAVMYLGRIVELARGDRIFADPSHPYTEGLIRAAPRLHSREKSPAPVRGELPDATNIPDGCRYRGRCPIAQDICSREDPALDPVKHQSGHVAACHFARPWPISSRSTAQTQGKS